MRSTLEMFLTLGILISIPLLLSTLMASAQPVNCAKAEVSSEFAICNNEVLITLDEKLEALFFNQKSSAGTVPQRQKLTRDHTAWKVKRNRCDLDWTCLEKSYKNRIEQLKSKISRQG